jgi:hypothetical protein
VGLGLGLAGLLLGLGACADDAGVGSAESTTTTSSSSSSSGVADPTTSGPGVTSMATSADTTAGTTSEGTTVAADSTSSGGTSRGDTSSSGTTSEVTATDTSAGTTGGTSTGASPSCGDGIIDVGEQCDGDELQGFDCVSLGLPDGTLTCHPAMCTFDTSGCGFVGNCGNGIIDAGEQCDGADLQGFDCPSLGLGGGVLGCDPITCTFDTSMCMPGGGTSG